MLDEKTLSFAPVNLEETKALCIQFRVDSFVISFGDDKNFYGEDGKGEERYLRFLQDKIAIDPYTVVHLFHDKTIIGQIELGRLKTDSSIGYVNLFYLIPSYRGQGLGSHLEDYAVSYFKKLGLSKIMLSVSPTNKAAIAFYQKHGWIDIGTHPLNSEVRNMEKTI